VKIMDCVFCKIINKEIPSTVVYEDDKILAFKDINPMAPVHVLIVPKIHVQSLNELDNVSLEYINYAFSKISEIAEILGIDKSGYRTIINTGSDAGQTVKHVHIHILGGTKLPEKMA